MSLKFLQESLEKCRLPLSKGGLNMNELKELAKLLEIESDTKSREEICNQIEYSLEFKEYLVMEKDLDDISLDLEDRYSHLSGANLFAKLVNVVDEHTIYMFGETHNMVGLCGDCNKHESCITVEDFILKLIEKEKPMPIDI